MTSLFYRESIVNKFQSVALYKNLSGVFYYLGNLFIFATYCEEI